MSDREEGDAIVAMFLQLYLADQAAGTLRPLTAYQQRFAGYEELIAEEYASLQSGAPREDSLLPGSGAELEAAFSTAAAERYSGVEEIARGGMGVICRVWDGDLERSVAMKLLPKGAIADAPPGSKAARAAERFLREARITGQLEHPGIVPVHALGKDAEGRFFFTMTMVEGQEFGEIIRRARGGEDPHWSLPRAVEVVQRVCDAMAFAHGKGVVHRDLKPSNVMVGRFGETYVMDWGLARELDGQAPEVEDGAGGDLLAAMFSSRGTLAGDVLGTPAYMPPEQARGEIAAVGVRSDVYSIGAMLYELLAGHPPYRAPGSTASAQEVLDEVIAGPPPRLDERREVPAELAAICHKAMEREPERRYASVEELGQDLRAFLEQRVVRAYEVGTFAELRKWVRRNRAMAFAAVLLIVAPLSFAVRESYVAAQIRAARDAAEHELEARKEILGFLTDDLLASVSIDKQGRDVTMRQALDKAAERIEGKFADRPAVEAELRLTIGRTFRSLGIHDEAEKHIRRAVELWEQVAGPEDRRTLSARRNLAIIWRRLDRLEDALDLNREILAVSLRALGPEDDDTLAVQNNLGYALLRKGEFAEAEPLLRSVYETRTQVLGEGHKHTLISLQNLAQLYYLWGRPKQAGPLVERSLAHNRKYLPPDNPNQLISEQTWGHYMGSIGRHEAEIGSSARLCELSERIRGPEHAETVQCFVNLSISLRNVDKHAEALVADEEALERGKKLPAHHVLRFMILGGRAASLSELGRTEDARAVIAQMDALLASHPKIALAPRYYAWTAKANFHRHNEEWKLALPVYDELVNLFARAGIKGQKLGNLLFERGEVLHRLDRFAHAERDLLAAAPLLEISGQLDVVCTALTALYEEMNLPAKAEHWQKRLAEISSR